MRKVAPGRPSRWVRGIAVVATLLTLGVAPAAHADVRGPSAQATSQARRLPPPGTRRLIRIGPQSLVMEDDHGRFTMVDEAAAPPKVGRGLIAATATLGLLGAGMFFTFEEQNGLTLDIASRTWPR